MYQPLFLAVALAAVLTSAQEPCDPSISCPTFTCHPDPRCPIVDPSFTIHLPHPDCTKFYKCSDGNACEYICPLGLHFRITTQWCDYPYQACCDPRYECGTATPPIHCVPNPNCPASWKDSILLPRDNKPSGDIRRRSDEN